MPLFTWLLVQQCWDVRGEYCLRVCMYVCMLVCLLACLFDDAVRKWNCDWVTVLDWRWWGAMRSWPTLRHCPGAGVGGLRNIKSPPQSVSQPRFEPRTLHVRVRPVKAGANLSGIRGVSFIISQNTTAVTDTPPDTSLCIIRLSCSGNSKTTALFYSIRVWVAIWIRARWDIWTEGTVHHFRRTFLARCTSVCRAVIRQTNKL
jgi:hypothetical protein